jgi:undecaprenyl diphosphate synthase
MLFLKRLINKSELKGTIDKSRLPAHIAIIMDGNGRWAKKRGFTRSMGHREGSKTLKRIVKFCDSIGIKYLTVYAFSTENWKRPKEEVDTLMSLLLEYLRNAEKELGGDSVRIRIIGDICGLSPEIRSEAKRVMKLTERNEGICLNIALNYGSRSEIVAAVKEIAQSVEDGTIKASDIDESVISDKLYTSGIPDPDLLIRTSGEMRISNFLLWQSAYSEFWYTDVLWPDFSKNDLLQAIAEYQARSRRYGGV